MAAKREQILVRVIPPVKVGLKKLAAEKRQLTGKRSSVSREAAILLTKVVLRPQEAGKA